MTQYRHTLVYKNEEIAIDIFFLKRKTLAIEIHPSMKVIVKAPLCYGLNNVQAQIALKTNWIFKKLAYFHEKRHNSTVLPSFTRGEQHFFMGELYGLDLIPNSAINAVFFVNNTLQVHAKGEPTVTYVEQALKKWYLGQAEIHFFEILKRNLPPFLAMGYTCPSLRIRFMKTRWGSLSLRGMTLNADLIKAPLACIEYVIMHELCHLKHMNHSKAFYALLEKHMPDWKTRKQLLSHYHVKICDAPVFP